MKEKVERLAKGVFEYETPGILLSEEELLITVDAGKVYSGSFTIKNSKNTPIKGILYSSSELFRLEQESFTEKENVIHYSFYGDNMNPLESAKGEICIVSDCGEILIPFTVNIEVPYLNSSMGKIKDLFNFTNLAKADWAEAIKLFKSREFHRILLHHDTKYLLLYQNIIKSRSVSQALEEFLIAIRKKLHMNISVDKTVLNYDIGKESIMDKLLFTKDNWGYSEIRVSTDAPFLSMEHKLIWSDNFVGNTCPLEFVLNPVFMRSGNNYGRIYLATAHGIIIVEITCRCKKSEDKKDYNHRKIQQYQHKVAENYLDFRRNRMPLNQYVDETKAVLENLIALDRKNKDRYRLMHTHLLIISGEDREADQILEEYGPLAEGLKQSAVVSYCGYRYLLALLHKDEASIQEALYTIHDYYAKDCSDWKLLWFILYIDKKYDNDKVHKLEDIKEQYETGCRSPILYFEVASVFNEEPSLLHELGGFELQVMHWGINIGYTTKEAAMQFTYLAGKRKQFSLLVHHCLVRLYEKYRIKDMLIAICSLLIKGHQRSNKYFKWYRSGVEEQLRITELYEYYMYSIAENADIVLPQPILLYFIYNSSLSDRRKSFLYAYIVKNKETIPEIYRTYYKRMEQFIRKQITAHAINAGLALLYEEIIAEQELTPEIAEELPYVMFKHEIVCNNQNIKGVYVVHKEMQEEVYTPLAGGTALVDIYTEDAEVFLVDGFDNRYTATVEYTLNKLMHWEYYVNTCYDLHVNHSMLLLNLSEKAQTYLKFDEQSIEIRKHILGIKGLHQTYYNKNILDLIYYYYDNFEGELLEAYLQEIDLHGLDKADRDKIIEFFIIRDLNDKALAALEEFGFEGIAAGRLI